jgi:hypothetical protein
MNLFLLPLGLGILLLAVAAARRVAIDRRRPEHEAAAGLEVLRTLRWKEFAHFVSQSFEARGYAASTPERQPGIEGPDVVLLRGEERVLLQVKHGGSYHVGAGPVRALGALVAREKAQGGVIATSGGFDADAAEAAKGQPLTLLGGMALWGELRGLLPQAMVADADERALGLARQARSKITVLAIAGAALVLLGAGLWTLDALERRGAAREETPVRSAQPAPPAATPAAAPAAPAPAREAAVPPTAEPATPAAEPTAAELAQQREFAAAETLLVPGVASASWSTPSTLAVALRGPLEEARRAEILRDICARVVAREALRFTRLQVEMLGEPDAAAGPRWFPCR